MAALLRTDGTRATVRPAGKRWRLLELQAHVGGPIELMPGVAPLRMLLNEEGKLLGLPVNVEATALVQRRLVEIGRPLRYVPVIVGNVLVFEDGERF